MAAFGRKSVQIVPAGKPHRSDTQERKHAAQFYLRTRTTAHSEYVWVVLLIIC
jgi:hypothetical protein